MPNTDPYAPNFANAQTPEQMALAGAKTDSSYTGAKPSTITPSTLAPATPINPVIATPTPIPDVSHLAPDTTTPTPTVTTPSVATPMEQKVSDLLASIQSDNTSLTGKSSYTQQQNEALGVNSTSDAITGLNSQLTGLINESKAIPLQIQQDAQNGGANVTKGGLAPHQTAALRNNAIQSLSVSSQIDALNGQLANAMKKVDRAVALKYGDIEAAQKAKMDNLNLLLKDPSLTREQADRAAQQVANVKAQDAKIAVDKQNTTDTHDAILKAIANNTGNPKLTQDVINTLGLAKTPQDVAGILQLKGLSAEKPTLPASAQEYEYAKKNGYTGSYTQYQNEDANRKAIMAKAGSGSSGVFGGTASQSNVGLIAQAIINGDQPPITTGLYGNTAAVRAELEKRNFNYTKANQDFTATTKLLATLNGAQQTRLRQAVNQVDETLPLVQSLAEQWNGGNFPILNKANLALAKNGAYGQDAQSLATRLDAEIADITSELGTVYKGGNSSTDESLKLAATQLNANWSKQTLLDAIGLAKQNITYRKNSLNLVTGGVPNSQYNPTKENGGSTSVDLSTLDFKF